MSAIENPLFPLYGSGAVVAPAAASADETIQTGYRQLCLTNLGLNVCYIRTGIGAQTATTADYPVPPGLQVVITMPPTHDTIAHISAGGTSLHYMLGEGW